MLGIKTTHIFDDNILIIDNDNRVWIMGNNKYRRTGYQDDKVYLYQPIKTNIQLDSDENIKLFYVNEHLISFYTTKKRVYITHHTYQDDNINMVNNNDDENTDTDDNENNDNAEENEASDNTQENDNNTEDDADNVSAENNDESSDEFIDNDNVHTDVNKASVFIQNFPENEYIENLSVYHNNMSQKDGISLLINNADAVAYNEHIIFFVKDKRLFVYDYTARLYDNVLFNYLGLSVITHFAKNNIIYYEIIFPFNVNKIDSHVNYIYINSADYHHVISAKNREDGHPQVFWLYFRLDMIINSLDIHLCDENIYLLSDKKLYRYFYKTNRMDVNVHLNNDLLYLNGINDWNKAPFLITKNGLFRIADALIKTMDYHENLQYYVEHSYMDSSTCIIIYKKNAPQRYIVHKDNLLFNINDIIFYHLMDYGLVYYDKTNTLYFITSLLYPDNVGMTHIDKIPGKEVAFNIYMFNNLPIPINGIFGDGKELILVQSGNKYYYHLIGDHMDDDTKIKQFTEIKLDTINNTCQIENKYISYPVKKYNTSIYLQMSTHGNRFKKLLALAEFLDNDNNFFIKLVNLNVFTAHGDGVKREFIHDAIREFQNKYLVKSNHLTKFHTETMEKLNKDRLFYIGKMLNIAICHSNGPLNIRLPLNLLYHLKNKTRKFDLAELEYFAKKENPVVFNKIHTYRNDPEGFAALDTEYDSYEKYLEHLCGYDSNENKLLDMVCSNITKGFYSYGAIKNIAKMNFPTLDYYLSGDFLINRDLLIENITIRHYSLSDVDKYHQVINKNIRDLPENKLAVLLKNWTGTSVVERDAEYNITITNDQDESSNIYFGTCNRDLIISDNVIDNPEIFGSLIDIITQPFTKMIDE